MLFPNTWVPKAASGLLTEHSGLVEEGTADPHRSAGPVHRSSAPDDHPSALQSHSTLWDRKLLEKLIFRDGGSAFDSRRLHHRKEFEPPSGLLAGGGASSAGVSQSVELRWPPADRFGAGQHKYPTMLDTRWPGSSPIRVIWWGVVSRLASHSG